MNLNKRVASNIKQLRAAKQIKQSVLAKDLNMSVENLSRLENGKINITVDFLDQVAKKLDTTVTAIISSSLNEQDRIQKKIDLLLKLFETSVHRGFIDSEMLSQNEKIINQQQAILELMKSPKFETILPFLKKTFNDSEKMD